MKTTGEAGIFLIKTREGFKSKKYLCPAGIPSIGYGHVILKGEIFDEITEAGAGALLQKDLIGIESQVNSLVNVPLTQNQFDALVSFTYNVGPGNFSRSTLLRKLNAGDYEAAAGQFKRWVYGGGVILPGLVSRREEEKELFLTKEGL